jgi:hypothetical protein
MVRLLFFSPFFGSETFAIQRYCSAAVALALQRMRFRASALDMVSPTNSPLWRSLSDEESPASPSSLSGPVANLSSTATFALKRFNAKMIEMSESKRKTRPGVLAVTATHLSFEQTGGSKKKLAARAAVFWDFGFSVSYFCLGGRKAVCTA